MQGRFRARPGLKYHVRVDVGKTLPPRDPFLPTASICEMIIYVCKPLSRPTPEDPCKLWHACGHVISIITPLRGMLLVYRPEGGGSINRNIPIRGMIIDF